ncbi:MAG: hypothetical protein ACHQ2E_03770 [Gemmatimonadales bacterium]
MTARLSRRFYDALGDEIANELVDWFNAVDLTYRTELRELNDLHWARMDARFDALTAELRAMESRFDAKLRAMEARFDGKLVELEARTNARFDALQSLLGKQLAETRADLIKWMFVFWVGTMLTMIGFMVTVIRLR